MFHFSFSYLVLFYMCVIKSLFHTMSIRNCFLWLCNNLYIYIYIYIYIYTHIYLLIPSSSVYRNLPLHHPRDTFNLHTLYKQKLQTCIYLLCCPKFELITRKLSCQRKQNTWRQFPSQLCVEANAAPNYVLLKCIPWKVICPQFRAELDYHATRGIFHLRTLWMG